MYNLNYLLKYVSMKTYEKIINEKNDYILNELSINHRNVTLNIEYLLDYGIHLKDELIYNNLEDLINESYFETKIKEFEKTLTKKEVITIIENI